MQHAYRLIIFDFDGTIVDSQHFITVCATQAFEDCGVPAPAPEEIARFIGLSLHEFVSSLLNDNYSAGVMAKIVERYRELFFVLRQQPGFREPLFEGVVETLDQLNQDHVLMGIATGKAMRGLKFTLQQHKLEKYFPILQTPDIAPGKPHPAMIEQSISLVGCDKSETILIGDTTFDVTMAQNADVESIGVAWGYHKRDALSAAGATAIADTFSDIPGILTALSD